jgi:hypothetical protein
MHRVCSAALTGSHQQYRDRDVYVRSFCCGGMGCGPPSKYERIYTTVSTMTLVLRTCLTLCAQVRGVCEFKRDFSAVGISEEDIGKFYWIFCKIDTDGSQLIEILELLMFLDVERTRFTKRIFSIFDDDKSGKIDFREFVLSVCE